MIDLQTILAMLIVLAATIYVARRLLHRYRSFIAIRNGDASTCLSGCGKCSGTSPRPVKPAAPVLVQISSSQPAQRRAARL